MSSVVIPPSPRSPTSPTLFSPTPTLVAQPYAASQASYDVSFTDVYERMQRQAEERQARCMACCACTSCSSVPGYGLWVTAVRLVARLTCG